MSSVLVSLAAFVALAYVGIAVVLVLAQRALMYHPASMNDAPAAMGVAEMTVVRLVTADGLDLASWYAPPQPGAPVVVYYHGNAGNIAMRAFKARRFLDAGFGMLLVGYRGFGGNPGRPSEHGLYADGRAALDWLAGQGIDGGRVVIYGESLGTGVAVQMAVERPPAALVLEAPFTSATDVAAAIYPFLPVRLLMRDRFDNLAKIQALAAPLLVVHGEADRIVPFRFGKRLFEAAPQPKQAVFLPQANHNDLYDWGAGDAIVEFLAKTREPALTN